MPFNYSGNASNITTPLARTVSSVTNSGGLYEITTSTAHLFTTNDTVVVQGTTGSGGFAADGTWVITVVDATHFTLNGSSFTGGYTSGGTATDQSLTPFFALPLDGENFTSAILAVPVEALADRTQYLINQINVGGVKAIQYGSVATMEALSGTPNGQMFYAQGFGLYQYVSSSSASTDGLLVLPATGNGIGRWLHELYLNGNTNPGFAVVGTAGGASGKVPLSVVPNGTLSFVKLSSLSAFSTSSGTPVLVTGSTISVPSTAAGDILYININTNAGDGGTGAVIIRIDDNGTNTDAYFEVTNNTLQNITGSTIYTCAGSGPLTVSIFAQAGTTLSITGTSVVPQIPLIVQHIKP